MRPHARRTGVVVEELDREVLVYDLARNAAHCLQGVTALVWRRRASWPIRFTALLLATLLSSPHVLVYDSVLLAPALVWLIDQAQTSGQRWVGAMAVLLAIAFVLPVARLSFLPLTIPLMAGLLAICLVQALPDASPPGGGRH